MPHVVATAQHQSFAWPGNARCAVSLSFDDARLSAIDTGVPLLDRFGVKGTFYVVPEHVEKRREAWRSAAEQGHEMGNHTVNHPCSGNFAFIQQRGTAVEEYTLEGMEQELIDANARIEAMLGVRPRTFAYPCAQTFVGRGAQRRSYVPVVAQHFEIGRCGFNECAADPSYCDLAAVPAISMDNASWEELEPVLADVATRGSWLILLGHEVAQRGRQGVDATVLEKLCAYGTAPENGVWLDTVANVGAHVREQRGVGVAAAQG